MPESSANAYVPELDERADCQLAVVMSVWGQAEVAAFPEHVRCSTPTTDGLNSDIEPNPKIAISRLSLSNDRQVIAFDRS
jgi:hypothetical protein